jgi:hypothetical protein
MMYGSSFGEALQDAEGFGWEASTSAKPNWQHLVQQKVSLDTLPFHASLI